MNDFSERSNKANILGDEKLAELLQEITRRILAVSAPEQIILFGSYVYGEPGPDSDLDLLVVTEGVKAPRQESVRLRRALRGLLVPIDVIVATPQQIARHRDSIGLIYGPAIRDGRVIYERTAVSCHGRRSSFHTGNGKAGVSLGGEADR
jgi:predicted nucleotidyltransferase